LWSSLNRLRRLQLSNRSNPLVEFRLPESITQHILAADSQARHLCHTAPLMGLFSLQHLQNRRSTHRERCLPAMFRLQGLITLLTAYALRSLAGFISHRQRSWDSPFGASSSGKVFQTFPPGRTHIPFRAACIPCAEAPGRLGRLRFLGFDTFPSPWRPCVGLIRRPLAAPLGFALLGFLHESLDRDFARSPLTRFANHRKGHPLRRRVSVGLRTFFIRPCGEPPGFGQSHPFRVSTPA